VKKETTAVAVFLKYPEPGKVKTRLAAELGNEPAANLYREMVRQIRAGLLSRLPKESFTVYFFCDPFQSLSTYRSWLGDEFPLRLQLGTDLGERLKGAFENLLAAHGSAVAIGTDCLDLDASHLEETRRALLTDSELVLGPAQDGGYYLIGMRSFHPELFRDISWSTNRVLEQTLDRARELALRSRQLETLADIDTMEDLQRAFKSGDGKEKLPG